jgi:hypothetical protein
MAFLELVLPQDLDVPGSHRSYGDGSLHLPFQSGPLLEVYYLLRDFESPSNDYDIHRPSVGIEHAFSPTLNGRIQLGYYWADPERGDTIDDIYFDVNVSQRAERTTYTIALQGGFTEDFFTAENLGFNKYYRGIGRVSHQLLERMTVGILAVTNGLNTEMSLDTEAKDHLDDRWRCSYQLFRG